MDLEELRNFPGLDTDFIELFHHGQLADLFEGVPPDQHEHRIQQLNEVITANLRAYRRRRAREAGFIHLHWLFGIFPLPLVNYRLIWRQYGPPNIREILWNIANQMTHLFLRLVQFGGFLIVSSAYLQTMLRHVFVYSNMLTYSENFFRDFVTFILRNNKGLLAHKAEMHRQGADLVLFLQQQEWNGSFRWLFLALYSSLALFIQAECRKDPDLGKTLCVVQKDNLVFRFANIVGERARFSDLWQLTAATAALYLFYALGGDVICINISWLYVRNIVRRLLPYKDVAYGVMMILYKTLSKTM